ncbi:ATP-binding protein [Euryarchaeota archaeon]|nr:ATP-binding protein [Euryarchaeota archaeon]
MPYTLSMQPPDNQFKGLAKNGMECGHCICELIDNSIAAKDSDFKIQIHLLANQDEKLLDVFIMDASGGMDFDTLKTALPLGSSPGDNQLNEHGFGLKNALATLSNKNVLPWELITKKGAEISKVSGPFSSNMEIYSTQMGDAVTLNEEDWMRFYNEISTMVKFTLTKRFFNTLKAKHGAHATDPSTLRYYLIEEIAMKYANYLTGDGSGSISLTYLTDVHEILPLIPPIAGGHKDLTCIVTKAGGAEEQLQMRYKWGDIDPLLQSECVQSKLNGAIEKKPSKKYFKAPGTINTQGFSVVLGRRTIIPTKFNDVWPTGATDEEGDPEYLKSHNNYNHYLGQLVIKTFPEKTLTTVNNKIGVDPDDTNWHKVFSALGADADTKPIGSSNEAWSEKQYEDALVAKNQGVPGIEMVSRQDTVWPSGVRMDCIVKQNNGHITVYELKVKKVGTLDLYQLKMYWDGLVDQGDTPTTGVLAGHEFIPQIDQMITKINSMEDEQGNNYNIEKKFLSTPPAEGGLGLN